MKFSEKQMEILRKIWEQKGYITITGVNSYGEEFETTGRITTTDRGAMGVTAETGCVYVEFGTSKDDPDRKQTSYFAPFKSQCKDKPYRELYIFDIKYGDEVIFENDEKEIILEKTQKHAEQDRLLMEKEGRDEIVDCPVVRALRTMIGKPINLDGNTGVLIALKGSNFYGGPMLDIFSGPLLGGIHVSASSMLLTEDNQGEITLLAKNNPAEYKQNLKPILANIESHSKAKQQ